MFFLQYWTYVEIYLKLLFKMYKFLWNSYNLIEFIKAIRTFRNYCTRYFFFIDIGYLGPEISKKLLFHKKKHPFSFI